MPASTRYGYVTATVPSNLPKDHPAHGKVPDHRVHRPRRYLPFRQRRERQAAGHHLHRAATSSFPATPPSSSARRRTRNCNRTSARRSSPSDGTTLLGADDKAGIAIIMTAVQSLLNNPALLHGDIRIGFTPDEEVGNGTNSSTSRRSAPCRVHGRRRHAGRTEQRDIQRQFGRHHRPRQKHPSRLGEGDHGEFPPRHGGHHRPDAERHGAGDDGRLRAVHPSAYHRRRRGEVAR